MSNNNPPPLVPPVAVVTQVSQAPANPRRMYRQPELLHLFGIMLEILPIGPNEWQRVVDLHGEQYPGRDKDSIVRKFTALHRRKIPTGDPNMPPEIRLAKRIKYGIGDKAELADGTGEYDMFARDEGLPEVGAEGEDEESEPEPAPPALREPAFTDVNRPPATVAASRPPADDTNPVSTPPRKKLGGLTSCGGKKVDFMSLMHLQMQNDSAQRAHEARMQAANIAQLNTMVASIASAYFGNVVTPNEKPVKKAKHKKRRRQVIDIHSSSDSSMSVSGRNIPKYEPSSDSESSESSIALLRPVFRNRKRSAD